MKDNEKVDQQVDSTEENGVTRRQFLAKGTAFTAAAAVTLSGLTMLSKPDLMSAQIQANSSASTAERAANGGNATYLIARENGSGSINHI